MADLGDVVVKLTADVGQFQTGFNQATTSLQNFQNTTTTATAGNRTFYEGVEQAGIFATGSERGIRRMEMALGGIAAQTVGASHGMGLLTESLLLFSGGSAIAIGVLAGIVAITEAFQLMSAEATADSEATKALTKELDKLGEHAKVTSLQIQISELERLRDDPSFFERAKQIGKEFFQSLIGGAESTDVGIREALNRQIATLTNEMARAQEKWNDHVEHAVEVTARQNDELEQMADRLDKLQPRMDAAAQAYVNFINSTEAGRALESKAFRDVVDNAGREIDRVIAEGQRIFDRDLAETNRLAQRWGDRIGRDLAQAIMNGFSDMQGLMKRVFEQVLSYALGQFFGSIFKGTIGGGGIGTVGADASGGGISGSRMAGGAVTLDMSKVSPLTAFAVARDPGFQEVLRAAILVANQSGFRTP